MLSLGLIVQTHTAAIGESLHRGAWIEDERTKEKEKRKKQSSSQVRS